MSDEQLALTFLAFCCALYSYANFLKNCKPLKQYFVKSTTRKRNPSNFNNLPFVGIKHCEGWKTCKIWR